MPQVSTWAHKQRIHTQGHDWIFKDLLLTTMKAANIFFIQTPLSPLWPPLFLEHVLLFKFHQLLLSMTGKGHFLSFIASLATDRTTGAKGGGEGTKASIRAMLTQRGIQQQNITSVNACPELREKGDPGSFPSLTEHGSGLSSPFQCEVGPREEKIRGMGVLVASRRGCKAQQQAPQDTEFEDTSSNLHPP